MGELGRVPLSCADALSDALSEAGFAVADNAASGAWCADVRRDIRGLHALNLLQRSLNRVATARADGAGGAAEGHLCEKKGIHELDILLNGALAAPEALDAAPALRAWLGDSLQWREGGNEADAVGERPARDGSGCGALMAALNAAAPWLGLTHLDTLKVQYNEGVGGCFPMHFDTTPAISRRTLTAILYLSDEWLPEHGGKLRLYPFPLADVEVAPEAGQLVLFSSTTTLHRVLPATAGAPRCVLSLWFAGAAPPFPQRYPPWAERCAAEQEPAITPPVLAFLRRPANARVLCKVLLADAWADSITAAFGHSAGVHEALALHYKEADALEKQCSVPMLHLLRTRLPLRPPAEAQDEA